MAGYKYDGLRIDNRFKPNLKSFKVQKYTVVEVGFSPTAAGIDNVTAAELGAEVKGGNGVITVSASAAAKVAVYTVNGNLVDSADIDGNHTFAAQAGAYIVKLTADSKTATVKVVVK